MMSSDTHKAHGWQRNWMISRCRVRVLVTVVAVVGVLAACTSSNSNGNHSGGSSGKSTSGGAVSFAEPPGTIPSWILPFVSTTDYNYFGDFQWDWQMWRPAYFVGTPTTPNISYPESLALPPVFSNHDTTVSVTLKPWNWSDGTPITARNLLFFYNILRIEKLNWWLYIPGSFPDNVKSASITGTRTLTFQLTHSVNPQLLAQNDLQSLTPMPLAWDRTALSGDHGAGSTLPAGSGAGPDMTAAGAQRVYQFLLSQNKLVSQYATNWLWKIVDGPFKLATYSVGGATSLVPNRAYGGTQAKISELSYVPFTSAASEFAALRSGGNIDVGYTSYANLSQQSALRGYNLAAWPSWAFSNWWLNFNNPKTGPVVSQLYVRQAMQSLVDEPAIVKDVYHGQAVPSLGPVPLDPPNKWLTPYAKSYPYPFNPSHAVALLKSHGWTVRPGGVSTCTQPGSAANECGGGIASGTQLSFTMLYSNGLPENQTQAIVEKSDFSKAGILLSLRPVAPASLFEDAPACKASQSSCSWQIMSYQDYTPFPYPYSGINFATGGVYNFGSYSDPMTDALLQAAAISPKADGLSAALAQSNDRILQQAVQIYQPTTPYQLTEVRSNLRGVTPQSPQFAITPELWSFTK